MSKKIGIIGCGTIGKEICRALLSGQVNASLCGVADAMPESLRKATEDFSREFGVTIPVLSTEELIKAADLVVEATSKAAAPAIVEIALAHGRDIILLSAGALLEAYESLSARAAEAGCRIYVPSGALGGLDAVKGAMSGEVYSVTLTTTKPPKGLAGVPYLESKGIDVLALREATEVFAGTAREAVPLFPANINVAAALSMAGVGPDKTLVRIVADPACTRNTHEVRIEGSFGVFTSKCENLPAPFNPRTSTMASFSTIALLRRLTSSLQIGS